MCQLIICLHLLFSLHDANHTDCLHNSCLLRNAGCNNARWSSHLSCIYSRFRLLENRWLLGKPPNRPTNRKFLATTGYLGSVSSYRCPSNQIVRINLLSRCIYAQMCLYYEECPYKTRRYMPWWKTTMYHRTMLNGCMSRTGNREL